MRLAVSFHRTFPLSRPAISQLLELVSLIGDNSSYEGLSKREIREGTSLGTVYAEAMPRYAVAAGLLNDDKRLTPFGRLVCQHDIELLNPSTLWLMHYHMVSPTGCAPLYWREFVIKHFHEDNKLDPDQLASELAEMQENRGGKDLAATTIRPAVTVFLGSYAKDDGLGRLRLVEQNNDGCYTICEPASISLWAFAYMLADFWEGQWGVRTGINLNSLTEPGGLASLLHLYTGDMNDLLGNMAQHGLVEVQRMVPPYQLVRLWKNKEDILEHLYE